MQTFLRGLVAALMASAVVTAVSPATGQALSAVQTGSTAGVPAVGSVLPEAGQTVGVAYPITVTFTTAVGDRAAAERGIRVHAADSPAGHFDWTDSRTVQWVPDEWWTPYTKVEVDVHGMTTDFEVGPAVTAVASISEHTFTVSRNGEILRIMPASMGKPTRPTPVGSFTALSKERKVKFDSRTIGIPLSDPEGYLIDGQYGVRVTWGGVYVHSAPWSVDSQGYSNVSHGCINLSPDNAAWYFDTVNLGDPIIVQA